jgi:cytochrome P450
MGEQVRPGDTPVPGPRALPVIGHIPWLARSPLTSLEHLGRTYGDISSFRIGPRRVVFVNHPELMREILQSQRFLRTPVSRRLLGAFLGEGVFSQEGPVHVQQRRLMQPAFHHHRIAGYTQDMITLTSMQLDAWRPGEVRDLVPEMTRLTFAIVARALFSTDTGDEVRRVFHALRDVQEAIDWRYEVYAALPAWAPLITGRRMRRAVDVLQGFTRTMIAQRRADGVDRGDLLSMLISARDEDGAMMSDEQLVGQSLSILFAGHETTANTLCWTWHLLGQHPEARARLEEEVQAVVGARALTPADLPRLPYTAQVIDEALRLMPPAWWAERMPLEEVNLGGYRVPAGTPVVMSVYVTHRDARFFPRPAHFDPDRFAPGWAEQIPRYAYLPFGAGAHICIGNTFARLEARIILATMAQRLRLAAVPGHHPRPRPVVTMGVANGLPMRVVAVRQEPIMG